MTLAWVGQEEFSAGILRASARGAEPGVGVITARNALFDDDGDVYRRGGDTYASDSTGDPLTFLWSGYLADQPCTLVASATSMWRMTPTGLEFIVDPVGLPRPVLPAVVGGQLWLPNGKSWIGETWLRTWDTPVSLPYIGHVAAIADRLAVAAGNRIAFSLPLNEGDETPTFDPTDYHELPDGVTVVGMLAMRDTLLVFTNYGLWSIANMAYDLTDAEGNVQHTLSRITSELSLLHESGLCEWAGKIIVPCVDRVFLVDTITAPIPISDSISPLYMSHIAAGHKPGGAKVFRNHLFLPFLDQANHVADLLVCRVNRPVRGRFIYYPWSTFDGHGGDALAFDVNLLEPAPRLLGAGYDGYLSDLTDVFNPGDTNTSDADGSTHEFELQTRDIVTGTGQPNHTKRLRLYFTLKGQGSVEAAYSTGSQVQSYEALLEAGADYQYVSDTYASYEQVFRGGETSAVTTLEDPGRWWQGLPEQAFAGGADPVNWNFKRADRARFIRAWVHCSDPVSKLVIHRIEFGVRPATHQR